MAPTTHAEVLVRNIRAVRSRKGLEQANAVARMRALGYLNWHRQTMGKIERGERRVTTDEVLGLACALETTVGALMTPRDEDRIVAFPSGETVSVQSVRLSVRAHYQEPPVVSWEGDVPVFSQQAEPGTETG